MTGYICDLGRNRKIRSKRVITLRKLGINNIYYGQRYFYLDVEAKEYSRNANKISIYELKYRLEMRTTFCDNTNTDECVVSFRKMLKLLRGYYERFYLPIMEYKKLEYI